MRSDFQRWIANELGMTYTRYQKVVPQDERIKYYDAYQRGIRVSMRPLDQI